MPGLFGEKNVKWVTRIDLVTEETKGFYEQQGWGPNFVVPTVSRFTELGFDRPLTAGAPVTLRGTAFAGNRGVSGVEVSVDDGATWQPAQLEYSGSPLAWVLWRYDWRPDRPGSTAARPGRRWGRRAADRRAAVERPGGRHRISPRHGQGRGLSSGGDGALRELVLVRAPRRAGRCSGPCGHAPCPRLRISPPSMT